MLINAEFELKSEKNNLWFVELNNSYLQKLIVAKSNSKYTNNINIVFIKILFVHNKFSSFYIMTKPLKPLAIKREYITF